MTDVFAEENGARIRLSLSPQINKGGVGTIHDVMGRPACVAKLYIDPAAAVLYEQKILSMLQTKPNLPDIDDKTTGKKLVQIAWPTALLRDAQNKPLGFLMPKVDFTDSSVLENVMGAKERRIEGIGDFFGHRVLLASNLAAVFEALHALGHHMIDLKPMNLNFYKAHWSMAILDTDGFSINTGNGRIPAEHFTPSYIAPEANGLSPRDLGEEQDKFALAVIIFRMMNNGVHPFQGTDPKNKNLPTVEQERINANLYPYGFKSHPDTGPSPSSMHEYFEDDTRILFDRAFLGSGSRPSAGEWRAHLRDLLGPSRLKLCTVNPSHAYFSKGCGLCALETRFPGLTAAVANVGPGQQLASTGPGVVSPPSKTVNSSTGAGASVPVPPAVTSTSTTQRSPKPKANLVGIVAGVALVFAVGWLIQRGNANNGNAKPKYPISNFAAPITLEPTVAFVNVRDGPDASYPVVKKVAQSEALTAYGTATSAGGGLWDYVKLGDGTVGYVNSRLVREVNAAQLASTAPADVPAATPVTQPAEPTVAPPPPQPVADTTPPPAPEAPVDEAGRARQVITSTNFYHDQSPDSGEIPGRTMVFRVDASYENARDGDVAQGVMMQNGQVVSRCNPIPLQTAGNFWCRIAVSQPGNYQFLLGVNTVQVARHDFLIQPPAQQGQIYVPQPAYGGQQLFNRQPQPNVVQQLLNQQMRHAERHPR